MRCRSARDLMSHLADAQELAGKPELAAHVASCAECREVWRDHTQLLADLNAQVPLPEFPELAPGLLARLGPRRRRRSIGWRWAAAALLLAALGLGYLLGSQSATASPPAETMAATYQEALSAAPLRSAEFAFAENGARPEAVPPRSAP